MKFRFKAALNTKSKHYKRHFFREKQKTKFNIIYYYQKLLKKKKEDSKNRNFYSSFFYLFHNELFFIG